MTTAVSMMPTVVSSRRILACRRLFPRYNTNRVDYIGFYWSGTLNHVIGGGSMYFKDSNYMSKLFGTRSDGLSIRPVRLVDV